MRDDVAAWFVDRSSRADDWPVERVRGRQGRHDGQRRPAGPRRGAATVGAIVASPSAARSVDVPQPLVDELVVIDSVLR